MDLNRLQLSHRCARAMACHSVVGLSCGSQITTTDAAWMLSPTPPATIWATRTAPCLGGRELIDHHLALTGGDRPRQWAEDTARHVPRHIAEDIEEVGEDNDSPPVGFRFIDDLGQSLHLCRT